MFLLTWINSSTTRQTVSSNPNLWFDIGRWAKCEEPLVPVSIAVDAWRKPQCRNYASLQNDIVALRPVMQAFARRFTRSDADAEDLVQETIMKALSHLDHFTPGTNLKSRMFTILRNHYCSQYKRSRRCRPVSDLSDGSFEIPDAIGSGLAIAAERCFRRD